MSDTKASALFLLLFLQLFPRPQPVHVVLPAVWVIAVDFQLVSQPEVAFPI